MRSRHPLGVGSFLSLAATCQASTFRSPSPRRSAATLQYGSRVGSRTVPCSTRTTGRRARAFVAVRSATGSPVDAHIVLGSAIVAALVAGALALNSDRGFRARAFDPCAAAGGRGARPRGGTSDASTASAMTFAGERERGAAWLGEHSKAELSSRGDLAFTVELKSPGRRRHPQPQPMPAPSAPASRPPPARHERPARTQRRADPRARRLVSARRRGGYLARRRTGDRGGGPRQEAPR